MVPTCSLSELAAALEAKVGSARAFFEGEAALLDVSRCDDASALQAEDAASRAIDYAALAALVRGYGMAPVAVRGAPEADVERIQAAGLAVVAGVAPARPRSGDALAATAGVSSAMAATAAAPATTAASPDPISASLTACPASPSSSESDIVQGELGLDEPNPAALGAPGSNAAAVASTDIGAMVIDKALRSGQRVYAKGRDLVVLAQVNPGAELIADGSIHCYAPLRGRAVAGANGNTKATIFASNFQAELVSIAGVYKNFESIPAEVVGRQMCVRLREQDGASRIALEPISTE